MESRDDIQFDSYAIRVIHQELTTFVVSLFLETLLFGAFTVTYAMGAWSALRIISSGRRSMRSWVLLGMSTTMLGLAAAHLGLSLKLALVGFVAQSGSLESLDNALYGSSLWVAPLGAPRFGIYVTQTLIGDIFMVYRLFLVWNRSRKVIMLPAILCLVDGACGYLGLVPWKTAGAGYLVFAPIAFCFFSFVTNALSSGLIIWRVLRDVNQFTALSARLTLFMRVVEAIVQSAAIYSTASIALVVTFFLSPNIGFAACMSVFPPLIGLVFSLIVLRLARNEEDAASRSAPPMQVHDARARRPSSRPLTNAILHISPAPPPLMRISTLDFSGNSITGSMTSIKPPEPILRTSGFDLRDAEERKEGDYLGVLDIRASKASWNVC